MTDFRADLHCHTTASDGTLSPTEILCHAAEKGLAGLSITDHDTVNGYKEAIQAAKQHGILLGSGIELSSMCEEISVHVLGYDIDIRSEELLAFCQKHIARRKERNQRILERCAKKGMSVDASDLFAEIDRGKPIGRPHIALKLIEAGHVSTLQEAFNRFLGDGKPCFDPGYPMSTDETIEVIHQSGGKAFIAHPHFFRKSRFIQSLLEKPFDGIECYYSKCNPDQEKRWVKIAKEKNLIASGGSDFHGSIKPHIPLGCSWVDQETFDRIFERNRWTP